MNRIDALFASGKKDILNIYVTAGFPKKGDTLPIIEAIQNGGADIIEIGMPYSDPIADGETIQKSNNVALEQGMSLKVLFEELKELRSKVDIPVILMGYINPVLQYGVEAFCKSCKEAGVDGLILPDLPMQEYLEDYKELFQSNGLHNIFLITPQTSEARIREIDKNSSGFIYMVSSASTTGSTSGISEGMVSYFNNVSAMGLRNPKLIGFGIKDKASFNEACQYAEGAIIGSAFIRAISVEGGNPVDAAEFFVKSIR